MEEKIGTEVRPRIVRKALTEKSNVVEQKVESRVERPSSVQVKSTRLPSVLAIVLFVLLCGVSYFTWQLYSELNASELLLKSDEKQTVIQNVSKHILLPKGEDPVFATVTDPAKLPREPFFKNAAAGDKVLVFESSKKAVLYRPSVDKIVEMMPFEADMTL